MNSNYQVVLLTFPNYQLVKAFLSKLNKQVCRRARTTHVVQTLLQTSSGMTHVRDDVIRSLNINLALLRSFSRYYEQKKQYHLANIFLKSSVYFILCIYLKRLFFFTCHVATYCCCANYVYNRNWLKFMLYKIGSNVPVYFRWKKSKYKRHVSVKLTALDK